MTHVLFVVRRPLFLVLMWGSLLGLGFYGLGLHELTAGERGSAPRRWPADSRLNRSSDGYTLVVFAHPKCPCFRTTVAALARLSTDESTALRCLVVAAHPARQLDDWTVDFREYVSAEIPQAEIIDDLDVRETARFGARTSGEAMLYDRQGNLCFQGGLTATRGHAGFGGGEPLVKDILAGHGSGNSAKVYGCSLGRCESVR